MWRLAAQPGGWAWTPWPTCTTCCARRRSASRCVCTAFRRRISTKGRAGETGVHPLRWPRHGAAAPHGAALLRRFPEAGIRAGRPAPAVRQDRPNPFGEKHGVWVGFAPFSAHRGARPLPRSRAANSVRMLERYGRVFIHGGGGANRRSPRDGTHVSQRHAYGKVRFAREMDLIANLDCVVTMDSLVMHLASLATPVVSVWGATHPGWVFWATGFRPGTFCRPTWRAVPAQSSATSPAATATTAA